MDKRIKGGENTFDQNHYNIYNYDAVVNCCVIGGASLVSLSYYVQIKKKGDGISLVPKGNRGLPEIFLNF